MKKLIKANSITLLCSTKAQINISNSFDFLPISQLKDKEGNRIILKTIKEDGRKKRIKMPFFGYNGIVITCRSETRARGVRIGGKQLQNVVTLDYQFHNKNYNLKISSEKIHLTGALEEESGSEVFQEIAQYFDECQTLLDEIASLSDFEKETTKKEVIDFIYHSIPTENKYLNYFNMINEFPQDEVCSIEKETYTQEEFENKMDEVFAGIKLFTGKFEIYDIDVVNSFFTHRIKTSDGIPLYLLFRKLRELDNDMKVVFRNPLSPQIMLTIPCSNKVKTDSFHRFFIFTTGTINQHSPTFYPEAYNKYYQVVKIIKKILKEIDEEV